MTKAGRNNLLFLLSGLEYTVYVTLASFALSLALGLLIALFSLSKYTSLRVINRFYVEIFRSIPILVMLLWVYYGLPVLMNINLSPFVAGLLALAISDSAFEAEIFRAGIQSVERGQHEAADSIGLSYMDKMRYIILPQAIRRVLPPISNQFVYVLKMSSLVSIITLTDLTRMANELVVTEYRPLEIYTILALEYLVIVLLASQGVRWLERRMESGDKRVHVL